MKNTILSLGRVLNRTEQKTINGGSNNCAYYNGETGYYVLDLTQGEAQGLLSNANDHWCCNSCSTASWYPQSRLRRDPMEPT